MSKAVPLRSSAVKNGNIKRVIVVGQPMADAVSGEADDFCFPRDNVLS
jgi:hypothetical protein